MGTKTCPVCHKPYFSKQAPCHQEGCPATGDPTIKDASREPKPKHPAWGRYQNARRLWEDLVTSAAKAHRIMEDAADELVAAGEMTRDHR